MTTRRVTLSGMARALRAHPKVAEEYLQNLKAIGMTAVEPRTLAPRRKTGTYQGSETPFGKAPRPRNLPYQTGHPVPGDAEVFQALSVAGPFDRVGFANDARSPGGVLYGVFLEAKDGSHAAGHAAIVAAIKSGASEAWREAWQEVYG